MRCHRFEDEHDHAGLRLLVRQWRRRALEYSSTDAGEKTAAGVRRCADELEAEIRRMDAP